MIAYRMDSRLLLLVYHSENWKIYAVRKKYFVAFIIQLVWEWVVDFGTGETINYYAQNQLHWNVP